MKKVAFYTLGCKVNQYETEAMLEMFKKDGYTQVDSEDFADVYVINTCTVTHMSDRKSRQYIRRMKKKNPDAIIAVVGCYSQVSPEEILEIEEVNLVMGTNERRQIVEEIKKLSNTPIFDYLNQFQISSTNSDLKISKHLDKVTDLLNDAAQNSNLDEVLTDGFKNNKFFEKFVDIKDMVLGDANVFYVSR